MFTQLSVSKVILLKKNLRTEVERSAYVRVSANVRVSLQELLKVKKNWAHVYVAKSETISFDYLSPFVRLLN